jgi:hypothetical protein
MIAMKTSPIAGHKSHSRKLNPAASRIRRLCLRRARPCSPNTRSRSRVSTAFRLASAPDRPRLEFFVLRLAWAAELLAARTGLTLLPLFGKFLVLNQQRLELRFSRTGVESCFESTRSIRRLANYLGEDRVARLRSFPTQWSGHGDSSGRRTPSVGPEVAIGIPPGRCAVRALFQRVWITAREPGQQLQEPSKSPLLNRPKSSPALRHLQAPPIRQFEPVRQSLGRRS